MNFEIEEEQRQMIVLAIAELALSRPGWDWTLGELAELFEAREMFEQFKRTNADRVHVSRETLDSIPTQTAHGDEDLTPWLFGITRLNAGDFLKSCSSAGLRADPWNYRILRPALLELKRKYPKYDVPISEGEKKFPPTE
jgi:hypothetical protein